MRGTKQVKRNNRDSKTTVRKGGKSVILFQITALIVGVFLISGIIYSIVFTNSQDRLTQKSKEKLIESQGTLICSCNEYISNLLLQLNSLKNPGTTMESLKISVPEAVKDGTVTASLQVGSELLASIVDSGLFGSKLAVFVLPANLGVVNEPTIIMASDNNYIYKTLPQELVNLIELPEVDSEPFKARVNKSSTYELMMDGIPGLELKGEFLVTSYRFRPDPSAGELWYFDFTPMDEKLASIDHFYHSERNEISRLLSIILISSFLVLILISFFILSFLIRRKIIKPIEELVCSAEMVMEGDFDAIVPVRKGEEFSNLKIAFNEMLGSLKKILHISTGASPEEIPEKQDTSERASKAERRGRRGRSSILTEITILVMVVFIASGTLSIILFQNSQRRFIDSNKEKLVQSDAEMISSGYVFLTNTLVEILKLQGVTGDIAEEQLTFFQAVMNRTLCPEQEYSNAILKDMVDNGLLEVDDVIIATPAFPPSIPVPLVVMSNNKIYIYNELPQELQDLAELPAGTDDPYRKTIGGGSSYMLVDGGIPEMKITGKQLVVFYLFIPDPDAKPLWAFSFKPMDSDINSINDYYNSEKFRAGLVIGLTTAGSIILLITITFFILSFLIRTRITKPIDELAEIAEKVMEGDLDIEVPVRSGEEFESLKIAFNEMLKSLRNVLERSTGE